MNGRVYDPLLGRFLSPDNIVQDAGNSQSYNRYSYCLNNPFKYTDPSGYSILSKIGDGITNAMNWLANEEDRFASWQYNNHISSSANFSYDMNLGEPSTVSVSVIPGESGNGGGPTAFSPSRTDHPDVNFNPGAPIFNPNSGLYSFNGGSSGTSSLDPPLTISFAANSESPWGIPPPDPISIPISDPDGIWNSDIMRGLIPDIITLGVGYNFITGGGGGGSVEANWIIRGNNASWRPVYTSTPALGGGYSIGATVNIGGSNYSGEPNDITRDMLSTNSLKGNVPTIWVSAGAAEGGKVGITGTYTYAPGGQYFIGGYFNIGVGAPAGPVPINGAIGVSNTLIIHK